MGGQKLQLTEPSRHEEAAYAAAERQILKNREANQKHNSYEQEVREFSAIEAGDPEALRSAVGEVSGSIGLLADHPLRSAKNLAIVCITLASRASIRGGVSAETAFSLSDYYIQHVENLDDIDAVYQLSRRVEYRFACLVRDIRYKRGEQISVNYHTERCKRYISEHIQERLTVKELAAVLGITPNYLSSLFLENEGCTASEYILQEKLQIAKNMLVYSDYSLTDIADYLGFSSQSHLGTHFRKYTGMTLRNYQKTFRADQADSGF